VVKATSKGTRRNGYEHSRGKGQQNKTQADRKKNTAAARAFGGVWQTPLHPGICDRGSEAPGQPSVRRSPKCREGDGSLQDRARAGGAGNAFPWRKKGLEILPRKTAVELPPGGQSPEGIVLEEEGYGHSLADYITTRGTKYRMKTRLGRAQLRKGRPQVQGGGPAGGLNTKRGQEYLSWREDG